MAKLEDIEGIGKSFAQKLKAAGVSSVENLLKTGASPTGRKGLEEKTGIRHDLILEWVNHADLFRIRGVGEEYSDLLEAAGVDTVVELSKRNAENLFAALTKVNGEKKLVRQLPSKKQVESWIDHAKSLPRVITY